MKVGVVAQKHLRRVRAEANRVKAAEERMRAAIVACFESGESTRDIAPYAGLSHQRIQQILREEQQRSSD